MSSTFRLLLLVCSMQPLSLIAQSYCQPIHLSGGLTGDYIDGFVMGFINNTGSGFTGAPGYTDYRNEGPDFITSVSPGSTYTATITSGTDASDNSYAIWLDLNHDLVFADDERLAWAPASGTGPAVITTLEVTIPPGARTGYTTMRVMCCGFGNIIGACESYVSGDTEDYTVVIDNGAPCIPVYTYGTSQGDYIDGVVFGSINNTGSGGAAGEAYTNYANAGPGFITTVAPGAASPMTITAGSFDPFDPTAEHYGVWMDLDHDGVFADDEQLAAGTTTEAGEQLILNVSIPADALIGYTRMRVRSAFALDTMDACDWTGYGETEDYTVVIDDGAPCIPIFAYGALGHYVSAVQLGAINWSQPEEPATAWTDATQFGTHLQQGSTTTLTINGGPAASGYVSAWIDLNGDGFDANDLIGSLPVGTAFAQVSFDVTVSSLFSGYTRLRVVHSNANVAPCGLSDEGSAVDFAIVVDQPGWPCLPLLGHGTRYGDGFTDLTIDGDAYGTQAEYPYVTASFSTPLHNTIGGTMSIGFTAGAYVPETYRLWLDMNNDGDFSDADELLASYSSSFAGEAISMNVQIPATCPPGQHFLRLRANDDVGFPLSDACEDQLYGQVFDRLMAVEDPDGPCMPYLSSWTLYDDFIDGVELGGGQNLGTGGTYGAAYHDYPSPAISLLMGSTDTLRITGGAYGGDTYSAWIDYNADNDFADANESLGWAGIADPYGTGELVFTVPPGTTLGIKRMRVRCALDPLSDACADDLYGETEDYRVSIDVNTGLVTMTSPDIHLLPTPDGVQLVTDATWIGSDFTLFDATGRAIGSGRISSDRTEVPMLAFARGAYTVLVQHEATPTMKRFEW